MSYQLTHGRSQRPPPTSHKVAVSFSKDYHDINFHFKSTNCVYTISVERNNVDYLTRYNEWHNRRGEVYTLDQYAIAAIDSVIRLYEALKSGAGHWTLEYVVDTIVNWIIREIRMSNILWSMIKDWVKRAVWRLMRGVAGRAIERYITE